MAEDGFEILSLDHIQLAMPPGAEARARQFYGDILGMSETVKPARLALRGGCWFQAGAVALHLGVEADFRSARKAHPALVVRGLAALRKRLEAAGCVVTDDEPLEGAARAFVDDPFGNRIELMERA